MDTEHGATALTNVRPTPPLRAARGARVTAALPGGGGSVAPKVRSMRVREEAREIGGERRRGETGRPGVAHVEARVLNGVIGRSDAALVIAVDGNEAA